VSIGQAVCPIDQPGRLPIRSHLPHITPVVTLKGCDG
jgi:hypothetical protein